MNRDAMVIYLRDVRDLEVARYQLDQMHDKEKRAAEREIAALRRVKEKRQEEPHEPMGRMPGFGVACLVLALVAARVAVFCFSGFRELFVGLDNWLSSLGSLIPLALALAFALAAITLIFFSIGFFSDDKESYQEELAQVRAHNQEVDAAAAERQRQIDDATAAWSARSKYLRDESAKAGDLLERYYALNVLPSQYRSLIPVCYIYEYMSTSQATLEDTLMHEHMENGFERLEEKLDEVIAVVEEQVYETRCLRAENREQAQRLAAQNQLQLKLLERTEQNTADAARYAQLAECNTAACAYFELAAYLKD